MSRTPSPEIASAEAPETLLRLHRGLKVALVIALAGAALLVAGIGAHWDAPDLLFDPFTAAPAAALIVAALILGRLGRAQIVLARRLALWHGMQRLAKPGHTLPQVAQALAEFLREAAGAEHCALSLHEAPGSAAQLFVARLHPGALEAPFAARLPLTSGGRTIGALEFAGAPPARGGELRFLANLAAQAGLMIDNARLLDRLASKVATEERRRISLDLHDGTIQPYIGLKLGLEALRRKARGHDGLAREVDELVRMAAEGIGQLRQYVGRLKGGPAAAHPVSLVGAARLHAGRFAEYYGITVDVQAERDVVVNATLCDELVQVVREALANVRRHTEARRATIAIAEGTGTLRLEIQNDAADPEAASFHPRSLAERASALGGSVKVERRADRRTAVVVEVPA